MWGGAYTTETQRSGLGRAEVVVRFQMGWLLWVELGPLKHVRLLKSVSPHPRGHGLVVICLVKGNIWAQTYAQGQHHVKKKPEISKPRITKGCQPTTRS